jgi:aminopeptidase-like protein
MMGLVRALYPLPRSITGDGVRETLRLVSEWAPLELTEIPSGTPVFDWVVPPEWNVRAAWIADEAGTRIVDFAENTLHVVGYSEPVRTRMRGRDLRRRLCWLPDHLDWIPLRTSYYERTWGFCVTGAQLDRIDESSEYEVVIDSSLDENGSLTYGEHVIVGSEPHRGEILVSTYVCHPATCNDNLSGIAIAAALGRWFPAGTFRHSVRILFAPSTIGPIAWLAHTSALSHIREGIVVSCAGDRGPLNYKRSRDGTARIDRAAAQVLSTKPGASLRDFVPWGGDERQFSSPGIALPMGSLTRTPHGLYPEYHTSADGLDFVSAEMLADSLATVVEILEVVDRDERLVRVDPRGEPQLSRHGIEGRMSGDLLRGGDAGRQALLWVLNLADGEHSLLDIADRAGIAFGLVREAADVLLEADLVRVAP